MATAIEHLESEGYITSRRGAGTYVVDQLPEELLQGTSLETYMVDVEGRTEPELSDYLATMFDVRPVRKSKKSHIFSSTRYFQFSI